MTVMSQANLDWQVFWIFIIVMFEPRTSVTGAIDDEEQQSRQQEAYNTF